MSLDRWNGEVTRKNKREVCVMNGCDVPGMIVMIALMSRDQGDLAIAVR